MSLKNRLGFLRRFIVLSPQITVLGITALLLSAALMFFGILIVQQDQTNRVALGYNYSDVNRPLTQFERELLRLMALAAAESQQYDDDEVQLLYDVLASRWEVIFWPTIQSVLPDETKQATQEMKVYWETLQNLVEDWQADPSNRSVRDEIVALIREFDFLVNKTEVRYQSLRGATLNQISGASERLIFALSVVSFLLVGFVAITAFSIYRFIRDSRIAEAKTREALAAQAAALENSRFKDQFLAVMSHELRTPLNAMIGFLGIMSMSGKLDEKNAHMVQRSRANAERLLALINDILDLSKLESGRMEFVPTTLRPYELVQQWRYQMDVLAKQKDLKFTVELDDSMPRQVEADEGAITKIVTNLLSNAFKFTEQGGVSLKMRTKDNFWVIEVQDTGIGVPAHMHGTIFESFRQVDNSFKRPYGGSGLGLSIVQHLVKAMDGTIRLESTVGKGSTFFVALPLKLVEKTLSVSQPVAQLT